MNRHDNESQNIIALDQLYATQCPDSELLADCFINGTSSQPPGLAEHLESCSECRDILRAMEAMRPFEDALRRGPGARQRSRSRFVALSVAASVLVVAGLSLLLIDNLEVPGNIDSAALRGNVEQSLIEPQNLATLPDAPQAFRFDNPDLQPARVELFNESLEMIWQSPSVQSSQIRLPDTVQDVLMPGHDYLWKVNRAAGIEFHTSPLYSFSIDAGDGES